MDNHTLDSFRYFLQSQKESQEQERIIKVAQTIQEGLQKLQQRVDELNTEYKCNAAVSEAQWIIDNVDVE